MEGVEDGSVEGMINALLISKSSNSTRFSVIQKARVDYLGKECLHLLV